MIMCSNPKFSLQPFEEVLKEVEKEFDGWEILAEKYHGWEYRKEIQDSLTTSDVEVQVHAPLNDINIASINPTIRKASIKEVKRSMEMASMIGSDIVTVHPGLYSPLSVYWDKTLKNSKRSLKELNEFAIEHNIKMAMENLPEMWLTICNTFEETKEFLDELELDFCLDVGHAYTAGDLEDFLEIKPINVHLHDNVGEEDVHLKLGDGEIDFREVLSSLNDFQGNFVIEGREMNELIESKNYLKKILDEIKKG